MKIKIINSNFDESTGISTVTIGTPLGQFSGIAKLHEEDRNRMSQYAGCQYAEIRAILKYIKVKMKNLDQQIKGLENYQKTWENNATYDFHSVASRTLRKQIYLLKNERYNWQLKYNNLNEKLQEAIAHREEIIKKIIKKKGGTE